MKENEVWKIYFKKEKRFRKIRLETMIDMRDNLIESHYKQYKIEIRRLKTKIQNLKALQLTERLIKDPETPTYNIKMKNTATKEKRKIEEEERILLKKLNFIKNAKKDIEEAKFLIILKNKDNRGRTYILEAKKLMQKAGDKLNTVLEEVSKEKVANTVEIMKLEHDNKQFYEEKAMEACVKFEMREDLEKKTISSNYKIIKIEKFKEEDDKNEGILLERCRKMKKRQNLCSSRQWLSCG